MTPAEPGFALESTEDATDLATLLSRARSVDPDAAVRLQAFAHVLATWVPVIYPAGLLDTSPVVLGLRVSALARPSNSDITVPAASVVDRIARITSGRAGGAGEPVWISAPPQRATAAWAGIVAPREGWVLRGRVTAGTVRDVAREGIHSVSEAVPTDSGAAVVARIRAEVWGTSSGWGPMDAPEIPDGAAFGLHVLGFVPSAASDVTVATEVTGQWVRLSTQLGHVLVKLGAR